MIMKSALEKALNEKSIYLDWEELQTIEKKIINEHIESFNQGLFPERTEFNNKEKAFSETWKKENKIESHVNQGQGTLQNLMFDRNNEPCYYITKNDRVIVATVIQWLGTNIGFNFLERSLKKCGYKIVAI